MEDQLATKAVVRNEKAGIAGVYSSEFLEGNVALMGNKGIDTNPYDIGTNEYYDWVKGFKDGYREALDYP